MQRDDTDHGTPTQTDPLAGVLASREARRALVATGLYRQTPDRRLVESAVTPHRVRVAALVVWAISCLGLVVALATSAHLAIVLTLVIVVGAALIPVLPTGRLNPFNRRARRRAQRLLEPTAIWQGFLRGEVALPLSRSCLRLIESLTGRAIRVRRAGTTEPIDILDVRAIRLDARAGASRRYAEVGLRDTSTEGVVTADDLDLLALSATLSTLVAADRTPVRIDDEELAAAKEALGRR
ncbi:MAG: hypothetical protein EAZ99_12205 [Alphaproteobacteria bacterium]|nr:MAG: hypothetical protein EAZ99_12205 [Alphaproteobacteria bacterium]